MQNNYNNTIEPLNLSVADQRVLAYRNYVSLLTQSPNNLTAKKAEAKAKGECWDAWHLDQVYRVNDFKLGS